MTFQILLSSPDNLYHPYYTGAASFEEAVLRGKVMFKEEFESDRTLTGFWVLCLDDNNVGISAKFIKAQVETTFTEVS